jgi:hypothetical protein
LGYGYEVMTKEATKYFDASGEEKIQRKAVLPSRHEFYWVIFKKAIELGEKRWLNRMR